MMPPLFEKLSQLWRKLLFYLERDRFDRELEEEMRFHLEAVTLFLIGGALGRAMAAIMKPVLLGLGIGLIGAHACARIMKSLLYQVPATDPTTFAGIAAVLVMVAFMAAYLPARRAARVDPIIALRLE